MSLLHIHDVLNIIYGSDRIYTVDELKEEIKNSHGEDVRLTSCSENQFEIDSMIDFMLQKGKIQLDGDKIYPFGEACNH